ncbi:MAG: cob(I)yrinic acid a,c-diamide adenosyltransferase [Candidatus Marinimicrobia bacterium]|nr:cob(I)yrinic acid a,c-diamide adenosyltransferase [Candidatus Neomarinimicrobiota bacterium]
MRITKVTTKTGDKGTTSLGNGTKVSKSDLRICCIGEVDELNSFIGHIKVATPDDDLVQELNTVQNNLLNLGGELSIPDKNLELLKDESIYHMETTIEIMNKELPPLKDFILPGGDEFSARLHIARSICRRAERTIVKLIEKEDGRDIWIKYLNRLSDYFFVLARYHTIKNNINENQWSKL